MFDLKPAAGYEALPYSPLPGSEEKIQLKKGDDTHTVEELRYEDNRYYI